jgi:hypothetical protein
MNFKRHLDAILGTTAFLSFLLDGAGLYSYRSNPVQRGRLLKLVKPSGQKMDESEGQRVIAKSWKSQFEEEEKRRITQDRLYDAGSFAIVVAVFLGGLIVHSFFSKSEK